MRLGELLTRIKVNFFRNVADKRKYPRVPLSVRVTNHDSGNFSYYQATNISIGGMFLKANEPLPIGARLDLEFSLPNLEDQAIKVQAEVVRLQKSDPSSTFPSGMGVKFLTPSRETTKAIKSFIGKKM